jgi:GNAT superfamily N-acetyltransferase
MPDSTHVIRPLQARDEADWRRLWSAYLEFYQSSVPEAVYAASFSRLVSAEDHTCHALVAERNGALVGLVHFLYHRHLWRIEPICYLQDLFVDPQARGGRIGEALIRAVYDAADRNGTPAVYWMTQEFNETARRLYDRVATVTPFIKYVRPL